VLYILFEYYVKRYTHTHTHTHTRARARARKLCFPKFIDSIKNV